MKKKIKIYDNEERLVKHKVIIAASQIQCRVTGCVHLGLPLHSSQRNEQKNSHGDHTHNTHVIDTVDHDDTKLLQYINQPNYSHILA